MNRNIDLHLQCIIDHTTGAGGVANSQREETFNYASEEPPPTDWSFAPASRLPLQEVSSSFNGLGRAPSSTSQQPLPSTATGSNRISLAPRSTYNQTDGQPRTISNADNHFKFAQHLRQGVPLKNAPPLPPPPAPPALSITQSVETVVQRSSNVGLFQGQYNAEPAASPMSQLATAMVLQRPIPLSQSDVEQANFFQGPHASRLNQLQPQRQQVTPPFNLSGYIHSPSSQQALESSSPLAGQASSPTTRISLRQRTAPSYDNVQDGFGKYNAPPQTPRNQVAPAKQSTSHTLTLGHAPPVAHGIQLVSPHELPDRFRQVFPYELFNAAQSKCFAPIYKTNDNVVVSAPTGSGKTAILELAICKLVESHAFGQFKIVYQAPIKALCSERLRDWQKKFSYLNLQCAELTGDTGVAEMAKVRNASIIVTTPEKWDSITRKWADHHKLVQMVKLFLIDEVHSLKDTRGATLEAVVSRMKSVGANVRFVALSATVPNSHDIAVWLGKDHTNQHLPAHRETFGEDFRPVRLQKHVYGYEGMMNDFVFEKVLDGKLAFLIHKHTHKKPIMVFNFTRKSCESTATLLAEWWTRQKVVERAWPAPNQRIILENMKLQELAGCGVAFHHAGLDPPDRLAIETAYLKGDISVICCTSTLAVGVNLPCHLIILKGTVGYQDGVLGEYSDLEIMQMLGRAGRPQFDDSAVAIIMTRQDKVDKYNKMISGQDVLESTLHLNLIEHLNSEICLGTVSNVESAKRWLGGTFLSVRMRQNPNYYKIEGVAPTRDTDQRLEQVCERDIKLLHENKLVTEGEKFACTEYGEAMSRYMVQFSTMKLLLSLPRHAKTEEILRLVCEASEFKDLRMKPNERPHLREFNKSPLIKYPIKETVSTTAHKISLMVQVQLGGIDPPNDKEFVSVKRQFASDKGIIFERIQRLIRCVLDCKLVDCDAVSTKHALDLARSLSAEYWENSNLQLRQIPQLGPAALRKLVNNDVNSIENLAKLDTAGIERVMTRNPPFGKKILDLLVGFPFLKLGLEMVGKMPSKPAQKPKVHVKATLWYSNAKVPVWMGRKPALTFLAETSDGGLVHFWRSNISKLEKGCELKFTVELSAPGDEIKGHIACDDIVGTLRSFTLKPDIPASAFPPPPPRTEEKTQSQPAKKKSAFDGLDDSDEFGEGEIEDDDLLAAAKSVEKPASDYGTDDFADIDDFEAAPATQGKMKAKETEEFESVQMENGKWTCNHHCRGGKILKNGQTCKHKCCHEGLDKPRKARTKASVGTAEKLPSNKTESNTTERGQARKSGPRAKGTSSRATGSNSRSVANPKSKTDASKLKLKKPDFSDSDLDDVEVVDLAQDPSATSYENFAPREYRKLHTLHASVQKQKDKNVRLPKVKPQFAYTSGEQPHLSFLQKNEEIDDIFDGEDFRDDEDFPSPSALFKGDHGRDVSRSFKPIAESPIKDVDAPTSSIWDDSLESLEAGMIGLSDSMMLRLPSPKINTSFANGVFDFDAFSNHKDDQEKSTSPHTKASMEEDRVPSPVTKESRKRERSASLELQMKRPRTMEEAQTEKSNPQSSIPSWVDEFDSDLIDGLKGFVDFVD